MPPSIPAFHSVPVSVGATPRLSVGQEQMWVLHEFDPADPAYLMSWAIWLNGPLDYEVLERAWAGLVERHAILRTRYARDGSRAIPVVDPPGGFRLHRIDLGTTQEQARSERAVQIASWLRRRPFDLATEQPLRVSVIRVSETVCLMVIAIHHIACDESSFGIVADELSQLYIACGDANAAALEPAPVQYAQYAAWEHACASDGVFDHHLGYWRRALAGLDELRLPLDRPHRARTRTHEPTRSVDVSLKPDLTEAVNALASTHRATPYAVMLAAYVALLASVCDHEDIAVGVPVSARTLPDLDAVVGYLVNTVVVRARCTAQTHFESLLREVRNSLFDALDHRAVPFSRVVEELNPARATATNPLFSVSFDMGVAEGPSLDLPGVECRQVRFGDAPAAKFDLIMHVAQTAEGQLVVRLECDAAVIEAATADRWAAYFAALLERAVAAPELTVGELQREIAVQSLAPRRSATRPLEPEEAGKAVAADGALLDTAGPAATISRAWSEVLRLEQVDPSANFFDVGGDSLRAVALAGLLKSAGLDVSATDVLMYQTIDELAEFCARARAACAVEAEPVRAVAPFSLIDPSIRAMLPDGVLDAYPLSGTQLGMVVEMRARPGVHTYQDSTSYRIHDGVALDADALQRACQLVVDRHEVLRTTLAITEYPVPLQLVHRHAALTVGVTRHATVTQQDWPRLIREFAAAERAALMDLAVAPLIRVHAHTSEDSPDWWITITECHPILEGWSFHVMLMEILEAYRDLLAGTVPAEVEAPPFRYADFIAAEAEARTSAQTRAFWRGVIEGRTDAVLPVAWRDPQEMPRDRHQQFVVYTDLVPDLQRLAAHTRTSMKAVLFAAHLKVVGTACGTDDFFTGLVCDARPEVLGAERVLGMYLNTLPFAMPTGTRTWGEFVRAVYDGITQLWPHRRMPLQSVQQESGTDGRLIEIFFNYLDFHQVDRSVVDWRSAYNDNENEFALHVFTIDTGVMKLNTTNHRLNRAAAERLAALYRAVLEDMALGPDGEMTGVFLPEAQWTGIRALAANGVQVLDRAMRPVPAGTVGELCLGEPGGALHRTGRPARRTESGGYICLDPDGPDGSRDDPRFLLHRTRELLDLLPQVRSCRVHRRPADGAGPGRLVAYLEPHDGASFDLDTVRRYLVGQGLSRSLIPDDVIIVESWPSDGRGGVDHARLPEPPQSQPEVSGSQKRWDERFTALLTQALEAVSYDGPLEPDLALADVGVNSFAMVSLLVGLEQAYEINIPDNFPIVDVFRTPATLWAAVEKLRVGAGE